MSKYNFAELRERVIKGGKLPEDVNSFVKEKLKAMGFLNAVIELERDEQHIDFDKIICVNVKNPLFHYEIEVEYGMVKKFYRVKEIVPKDGSFEYTICQRPTKNPLLDNKSPKKKEDNHGQSENS